MQTQITLEKSQLERLIQHTHSENGSEAILKIVQEYLQKIKPQTKKSYSFVGIGHSGKNNLSQQTETILARGTNKLEGWSLPE